MRAETRVVFLKGMSELMPTFDPMWDESTREAWQSAFRDLNQSLLEAVDDIEAERLREQEKRRLERLVIQELRHTGIIGEIAALIQQRVSERRAE